MAAPRLGLVAALLVTSACAREANVQEAPRLRVADPPPAAPRQAATAPQLAQTGDADDDGVLDADDFCPNEAEDADECNDEDGCPDQDNDGDGVADAADGCPNTSGSPQNRGCPQPPPPGKRIIVMEADGGPCGLVILEPIAFAPNDSALGADTAGILEKVAYVMKNCPQLLVLELRGQSSTHEGPGLAQRRAEAVRSDLLARGVPERRLRVSIGRIPPDDEHAHQLQFIVARHMSCPVTDH